jgi:amino acid adenylation domain-containing protein
MTELAERMAKLSPEQRALLEQRIRQSRRPAPVAGPIPRRARPNRNYLTVDQERIWLIHQFDPADPVYNVFFGWRMRGELDVDALERAVNLLVRRHEALRTTFELEDIRPVMVVHDDLPVTLRLVDLRDTPVQQRAAQALRLAQEEVRRPFDIATGPLLRVAVLRLDEREHVMVTTVDHLVWDRASVGIFDREVAEFYTALVTGREPDLPPLPIQYADYAEWQPDWLREVVQARHVPYWTSRLAGAELVLELPADRPRPPVQTFNGARYEFRFTAELTRSIRELARREGVTLYVTLLAAWNLLLHRWTGQQDIVVGTTSSTRSRPETEGLIGYFLTMLPLRTTVGPGMTFRELLRATRDTVVEAYDHNDIPFGTLLDELDIDRDPSRNPVYQTSFMFVDFHEAEVRMPGVTLEALVFDNNTAKDECMLCMFDDEVLADHLFGLLEYNTDLFTEQTAARLTRHLEMLLTGAVANPDAGIEALPLLDEAERRTVLVDWNRTAVDVEPGLDLVELIRRQARRTPGGVAVSCGDDRLTYAELLDAATRVAHELRLHGAAPETVVGVCLERSCDLVVGLLGVLLSGAAYLPLDPQFPTQRIAEYTVDSGARLLLTESALAAHVGDGEAERILFDRLPWAAAPPGPLPDVPIDDGRLAYVIYTSGSTGRPKGVEITHRNLVNFLLSMVDEVRVGPTDILAAVTSISFDIAGLELWGPLVRGGQTVVATRAQAQDPVALADLLVRCGATVMQATPATWHMLVESGWTNKTGVRIVTGGEALPEQLARSLVAPNGAWNAFGPTETTVWSTTWRLPEKPQEVSIGRPLANTEVYVLDEARQPVPVGMPGELYIGGIGVARGYRDRPALTADRFVPDHLGARPGGRLYHTGDQARWLPDGTLAFLGRNDGQVKLRGYRIELGEIEARLRELPQVGRAVVVVREDRPGDRRLVAYVESRSTVQPEAVRDHLRDLLPDYMVPAAVVTLAELPHTTSGKIDRRSLPAPVATRSSAFVAPRDHVELEVARVWAEVLGTGPVGLHDRFFDLGGHSLLVLRLMSEIERRFGQQLPMAAIFQGATVERFAHMLREGYREERDAHLVEIRGGGTRPPLFFAHPAGSEVVCYMPFAQLVDPGRPIYAIASPRLDVGGNLSYKSFEERAAAYADLVEAAQPTGTCTVAGWCYGGVNAFGIAQELTRRGRSARLIMIDAHAPVYVPEDVEPGRAPIVEALGLNLQWDRTDDLKSVEELSGLTDEEHLDYLLVLARKGDYLPPDAGREQMRDILDLWVANLRLLWRHRPDPLPVRFTHIRASEEDLEPFAGWARLAGAGIDERLVDGNHYTMMRPPRIGPVAEEINRVLGPADA